MNAVNPQPASMPEIVSRSEHDVSRANISPSALKVLYRLKEAGFMAFLVGGSVRDLLLGIQPKDFDVTTNAHPDEIARLFRNCRLIGRRFRLAHVRFGREIIEVATFRAGWDADADESELRVRDEGGRILRDNLYGSIDEDVWRRDFTANALYYNIADFSIWDFVGGVADVRARRLRLIGDPVTRYREDPVRMLRGVRLAAKLDFTIDPETEQPIRELAPLLADVPPARLFDEIVKLFQGGRAARSFELLREYGLFGELFPQAEESFQGPHGDTLLDLARRAMANTDERIARDLPVTPMFLFGVLLWGPIREQAVWVRESRGGSESQALTEAATQVVLEQQQRIALPKRFSVPMREMLVLQARLLQRNRRRVKRLLEHKRFRAAYDFLELRAASGDCAQEHVQWWRDAMAAEDGSAEAPQMPAQESAQEPAQAPSAARKRRRPRRRRRSGGGESES